MSEERYKRSETEEVFKRYIEWMQDGRRVVYLFLQAGADIPKILRDTVLEPVEGGGE